MSARVEVLPGEGVVFRYGQICVWAAGGCSAELLSFLGTSARNLGPSARGGLLLADHVAGVLERADPEPGAGFVTVGPDGAGGQAVVLHGPVRLWTGLQWQEPPGGTGWNRLTLAPAPIMLAGSAGTRPVPGGSHPILDLEAGAVPGGGFALIDAAAPPPGLEPPPALSAPVGAPAAAAPLTTPVPGAPGGEEVDSGEEVEVVAVAFAAPDSSGAGDAGAGAAQDAGSDAPTTVLPTAGAEPTVALPGGLVGAALPAPAGGGETGGGEAGGGETGGSETGGGSESASTGEQPAAWRPAGVLGLLPPPAGLRPGPPAGPVGAVPVVRGVRCPGGHFNHPATPACLRCGAPIDRRQPPGSGPRPPLGLVVVDDGSLYALDRSYLLGSGAGGDPSVTSGSARAMVLSGDRVASLHAEIRLDDWAVTLVDRAGDGSTHVLAPGRDGWRAVTPRGREVLRPGSHIAVGSRVLTFLSPWPA